MANSKMLQKRNHDKKRFAKRADRREGAEVNTLAFMAVAGLIGGVGAASVSEQYDPMVGGQTTHQNASLEEASPDDVSKYLVDEGVEIENPVEVAFNMAFADLEI